MRYKNFKLEEYFAKWEFHCDYPLCLSDTEAWTMREILEVSDSESLELWEHLKLGYTETQGLPLLRKEISKCYERISEDQILVSAGAEEAIYCAMQVLLSNQDHGIVVTPCYQSLLSLPQALANSVTTVELRPEMNWELEIDQVKNALRPNTKLIVINYPHNPTGVILQRETQDALIALAREHQVYILSDEVYRLMEFDPSSRLPALVDRYEKGISISVMTKAFGLGGLRIGWAASQDEKLLQNMAACKHYTSICNSAPSEILALIALRAKEKILLRNHQITSKNLAMLDSFIEKHADALQWTRPLGGCTGFVKLLINEPIDHFSNRLASEKGVLILPGTVYDYPGNYFRIGFGRRNFPEALERFGQFLKNRFK